MREALIARRSIGVRPCEASARIGADNASQQELDAMLQR